MEIIVGKTAGFCYGVRNAVNGLNKECENKKIDCLGEIVHNEEVCNNFKNKGVNFINDVKESKNKVVIRAHGVPKEVYNYLENNNIKYKDLTCPKVLKVHDICNQYKDEYFIFIIGSKIHPEIIGTKSFCKNYFIIENEEMIELGLKELNKTNLDKVLVISQTTYSSTKFDKIVSILKDKINKELVINKTICPATEMRQKETNELSKMVDLMIIVGSKTSSNTTKLYDIAKLNTKTLITLNGEDLNIDNTNIKVGIMAGASTPEESINNVINILKEIK